MKTFIPFSNSSAYEIWTARNCDRCKRRCSVRRALEARRNLTAAALIKLGATSHEVEALAFADIPPQCHGLTLVPESRRRGHDKNTLPLFQEEP